MPRSFLVKKVKLDDFSSADLENSYSRSRTDFNSRIHDKGKGIRSGGGLAGGGTSNLAVWKGRKERGGTGHRDGVETRGKSRPRVVAPGKAGTAGREAESAMESRYAAPFLECFCGTSGGGGGSKEPY